MELGSAVDGAFRPARFDSEASHHVPRHPSLHPVRLSHSALYHVPGLRRRLAVHDVLEMLCRCGLLQEMHDVR